MWKNFHAYWTTRASVIVALIVGGQVGVDFRSNAKVTCASGHSLLTCSTPRWMLQNLILGSNRGRVSAHSVTEYLEERLVWQW